MKHLFIFFIILSTVLKSYGQCVTPEVDGGGNSCSSNTIYLTAISFDTDSGSSHQWYTSATGYTTVTSEILEEEGMLITEVTVSSQTKSYWVSFKKSNCESSRVKVTATYTPNTAPILDVYNPSGILCGSLATFTLYAGGGNAGSTYKWFADETENILLYTGDEYSPTISSPTTYYVGGTLINNLGCSFPVATRVPVTATVYMPPPAPTASNTSRCGAGTVTFTASGISGATYWWYNSSGNYLVTANSYTTLSLDSTTNYQVKAYKNGCLSAAKIVIATITTPLPPPEVEDGVNSCSSNTIYLTAISFDTDIGSSHQWYTSATGYTAVASEILEEGGMLITEVAVSSQTKSYWVSFKKSNCESSRVQVTATYTPNMEPTLEVYSPLVTLCDPSDIFMYASGGTTGSTYEWFTEDESLLLYTGEEYSPTINETTSYYVGGTLINNLGCSFPVVTRVPVTASVFPLKAGTLVGNRNQLDYGVNRGNLSLINHNGTLINWQKSEDNEVSWSLVSGTDDGYNYSNLTKETKFKAIVLNSNCYGTKVSNVITLTVNDIDYNKTENTIFGENSTELSASKSYFDYTGKLLQTQSKDILNNDVFATAVVRDNQGRDALTTMAAPLGQTDFGYKPNFIESASGVAYNASNFDDNKYNPDPVSNTTPGTLGWYYSTNNTDEPNTPITGYPYSRTEFYEDGEIKRVASPGDMHRLGAVDNNVMGTFPVINELDDYINKRETILTYTATGINLQGKAIQQVSIDAEGKMAIAITDQEGNGVMSALAGGNVLSVTTPPSGFAADGSDQYKKYFYITNDETSLSWSGSSADVEIKDVWRNTSYTAPTSLNRGLYRVTAGSYRPGFTNYYSNISYNFYNDAGRLKTSVSPNGVEQLKAGVALSKIDKTTYTYNHKGWLLSITEPDAGTTNYLYRRDGKIRFSQNNQQKNNSVSIDSYFSYTNYDNAGRPLESGEYQRFWDDLDPIEFNDATMLTSLEDIGVNNYATSKASWVKSYYDLPVFTNELPTNYQNPTYLMGAVAVTENENSKTWYSYDSEGKVTWVVQKIIKFDGTNDKFFTINYTYNYYGNVTQVAFQKSEALEAFYHHYEYDFNQRLVNVRTSVNGDPEDAEAAYQHASYEYYKHGPLKRTVLGKNLQGLDYTYTIEGWLKSVNNPTADPGEDGIATSTYKDAFGMTLEYYTNDYTNAGQTETPVTGLGNYDEHYNGNIKATTWNKGSFEKPEPAPQTIVLNEYDANQSSVIARNMITLASGFKVEGEEFTAGIDPEAMIQPLNIDRSGAYAYTYDEKYQLEEATFATMQTGTPAFGTKFKETNLAYDANGNMQSLTRTNEAGTTTDNFTYNYNPATTTQQNNQLEDIPGYANYEYNAIGQLTQQTVENVTTFIAYDVTGKVTGVYKDTNHNTPITEFSYDDRGFRISKTTWDIEADTLLYTTWYIRDATGNVMATYDTKEVDDGEVTPVQTELPIYGSGRIGIAFNRTGTTLQYNYELTDHLGNVRSVVTPLKSMAIATMEDEYAQLEEFEFKNIAETRHTESGIFTAESSNMARLNNMPTDGSIANGIGPARILRVQEGDVIKMSVDARYFEKQGMNNGVVGAIASIITSGLGLTPAGETVQAYNALTDLLNAGSLVPPEQEGVPKAYLNYLLLDYNFNHIFDNEDTENQPWIMVTTAAATGTEKLLLELTAPVDGYMYIYVANETDDNINVYFDNLTITHTGLQVVEQTDYYPYGMVMRKELPNQGQGIYNPYRHGYQGQFAEKDEETGWNHFELRQYGSRIGRWTATDPYRQYYSPYVGMGNNPVYYTDPDGGFSSWIGAFGAWVASGFNGTIEKAGGARAGEYFIGRQYGLDGEAGIGYQRIFEVDNTNFVGKSYNVIDYGAGFTADFVGGVKDFGEQYITMTYLTNFLDSDKYFHSKANFNATLRGAGGEYAAEKLSNFREIFDQRIKGDSRLSSLEDQEANRYGRERANHYKVHFYGPINYKEAIPKFRTNRLLDEQGY